MVRTARILAAFVLRDLRWAASYRLWALVQGAQVLALAFTFFFVARMLEGARGGIPALEPYGGRYFGFALVGLAVSGYLDASLRSFSDALRRAQTTGTLAAMLSTGAPLGAVVAGSATFALVGALLRAVAFLGVGALLMGLPVETARWGAVLAVFGLTVGVSLVLGLFAAGFVIRFQRGDPVTAGLGALSWLASGVLYPKEVLPWPIQQMAAWLPLTHCLDGMRLALLVGAEWSALAPSMGALAAFFALGAPLAAVWFYRSVRAAKREGGLSRY